MHTLDELLEKLLAEGNSLRREHIEAMVESLRCGSIEGNQFAENLRRDTHWENLDELEAYVGRLLTAHRSGSLDRDSHGPIMRETVESCGARRGPQELPRPGDVDDQPPPRLAHVFHKTDWNGSVHEKEVWNVLTTEQFDDPAKRAALAPFANVRIRTGSPSSPPYHVAWATFALDADHPFAESKFASPLGLLDAQAVVEALGMDFHADSSSDSPYVLACYPTNGIGQLRMPTICDGGWGGQFRACGRTHPGGLPERLHRPLTLGDLDRKLIVLK